MKSLWIVNKVCGALHQKRFGKKATGGLWLEATLEGLSAFPDDRVVVVNVEKKPVLPYYQEGQVTFYTVTGEPNEKYDWQCACAKRQWQEIIEKEKPDVLVLWGTEFPYGLAAKAVARELPTVIFIQGILDSIGKYYTASLTKEELHTARTLRDVLMGDGILKSQKKFQKRAILEKELLNISKNVILENRWSEAYLKKICPDVACYRMPIGISESFQNAYWSKETMTPHTIMCSAANYPLKGLHMLLKALKLVKDRYPDVHLYIPGTVLRRPDSLTGKLKQSGYDKLILRMLQELDLEENVTYTGRLTSDEMAQKMANVNCFAMVSAIENHSSTLKEAMAVGVPCVASYVGGVPEYAVDGKNCFLYRYEDYEVLALKIMELFENPSVLTHKGNKEETAGDYTVFKSILEQVILKDK